MYCLILSSIVVSSRREEESGLFNCCLPLSSYCRCFRYYSSFPSWCHWSAAIYDCDPSRRTSYMGPVKRICVFEHSVMTNFNCACPAIQRGLGSGFLSEGSSSLTACMSEQRGFWRDCADAQARLNLRCSHRR